MKIIMVCDGCPEQYTCLKPCAMRIDEINKIMDKAMNKTKEKQKI